MVGIQRTLAMSLKAEMAIKDSIEVINQLIDVLTLEEDGTIAFNCDNLNLLDNLFLQTHALHKVVQEKVLIEE